MWAFAAPAAERLGQPSQRRAFRDGCKGPGLPITSRELEPGARPGSARRPGTGRPAAASAIEVALEPARAGLELSQALPVPARVAALIGAGARSLTASPSRSFGAPWEHCCAVTWPSGRRPVQATSGH